MQLIKTREMERSLHFPGLPNLVLTFPGKYGIISTCKKSFIRR